MSMSSNDNFDEGEVSVLSFISPHELVKVQIKQEMHSLIGFLFKVLHPDSMCLLSTEILTASLISQAQISYKVSENVLELIKSGCVQKYFPLCIPGNKNLGDEISISVMSCRSDHDIIAKLINCDKTGVYLARKESKLLFSLIIGGLRDSAVKELKETSVKLSKKKTRKAKKCLEIRETSKKTIEKIKNFQDEKQTLTNE